MPLRTAKVKDAVGNLLDLIFASSPTNSTTIAPAHTLVNADGDYIPVATDSTLQGVVTAIQGLTSQDAGLATDTHLTALITDVMSGLAPLATAIDQAAAKTVLDNILSELQSLVTEDAGLATVANQTAAKAVLDNILTGLGAVILAGGHVGIDQTTPGTTNGVVVNNGSTGTDYSANKPGLPNIGATSFTYTPDGKVYNLIATVPVGSSRANIDVENNSTEQILIIRDNGASANGQAPANASIFALAGASVAGGQGGGWASTTFKGRARIFAPTLTDQVCVTVD